MFSGRDYGRAAKEFIHYISLAVGEHCEELVKDIPFISVLSDGSQARKTNEDKELLLTRVVRNGSPIYILVNLLNMADYGGTDADSIKQGDIKLTEEEYHRKLVSATADGASVNFGAYRGVLTDGASVNFGAYRGVLTQMSENRDWLVKIHCVNHRVELAAKKVVNDSVFLQVEEFYLSIYFFHINFGRFKSECKHAAEFSGCRF